MKKDKDNLNKNRKEWNKEWALEKETEGLDKKSIKEQKKIVDSLQEDKQKYKQE